ncbi:hypothetical protein AALB51_20235 [Lachnospiraceae bacterium 62-26]
MNGDTLVNEIDIEKSYEAVARPFNFKKVKELIALLQQFPNSDSNKEHSRQYQNFRR